MNNGPQIKKPLLYSIVGHFVCLLFFLLVPTLKIIKPKTKVVWVELPKGASENIEIKMNEAKDLPKTTIQEQKEAIKQPESPKEKPMVQPPPKLKPQLRPVQPTPAPKKKKMTDVEKALASLNKIKPAPPEAAQVKDKGEGFKYGTGVQPLKVLPTDPEYIAYQAKVRAKIMAEWIVPLSYLEGAAKPRASLVVQINQQGEVISTDWEEQSGNPAFDSSCQRAVQRASPLPIPTTRLQWEAYSEGFLIQFDPSLKVQ